MIGIFHTKGRYWGLVTPENKDFLNLCLAHLLVTMHLFVCNDRPHASTTGPILTNIGKKINETMKTWVGTNENSGKIL